MTVPSLTYLSPGQVGEVSLCSIFQQIYGACEHGHPWAKSSAPQPGSHCEHTFTPLTVWYPQTNAWARGGGRHLLYFTDLFPPTSKT